MCYFLSWPEQLSLNAPSFRDLSVRSSSIFLCSLYFESSTSCMISFSRSILVATSPSNWFWSAKHNLVTIKLTCENILSLANFLVSFSYSVTDFLVDCIFKIVQSCVCIAAFLSVELTHLFYSVLKVFSQHFQFVFKFGSECFKGVIHSLRFCFGKVSIGLNFSFNILELGLQLFLGLNALH